MENIAQLEEKLNKLHRQLNILYEISNAMHTTLELEEILYIILTSVTAHVGLGFNRAMLFLVNNKQGIVEGKMAIGPDTGEEANHIWKSIEENKLDLDDLISMFKLSGQALKSNFNQQIQNLRLPLDEKNYLLNIAILEELPLHIKPETINNYSNDPLVQILKTKELAIVPLKGKNKINGIIIADNIFTKKSISQDDIHMLLMLANQAGLAIENSQLYEQAIIRSHTDSLTGLWNHGYFHQLLSGELEKRKINETALSLIFLDIDNFKIYNDRLGHQSGDGILKEIANLLSKYSRKMDYVARYGGEEFAIILPQADKKDALIIAERLRETIEKYPFANQEIMPNKKLTASLGIATLPDDTDTGSQLIKIADQRLYLAKDKGKNLTCFEG
ncbi:MAG: sensor domain-containing diguanylate cyclase [Candidatus Omnitrophica bacterium]|nr:sensor domain-containing diguanylate cyclase [Candidatus Omnitrophota bacterium]